LAALIWIPFPRLRRAGDDSGGRRRALLAAIVACLLPSVAHADPIPPDQRRSGFDQMSADTQAMQRDDLANPAMFAAREGEALWSAAPGGGRQACAGCHGDASQSMKGVAARYPAFDDAGKRPIDLAGRIQHCRTERQGGERWARESPPLLAMTAYVGLQSRGMTIAANPDPRLAPFREEGRAFFTRRMGQLDLSCAQCHDERWGRKLGSATIPQGHANGYPIFRLEWQGVGSLQRRLRNCLTGIRAEPFPYGDPALIALELHLQERAEGLKVETPAVRP
jgi:sulfur-oxidizing protein SoxA